MTNQPYAVRVRVDGRATGACLGDVKRLEVSGGTHRGGEAGLLLLRTSAASDDLRSWRWP
jgi:hypothetical protein